MGKIFDLQPWDSKIHIVRFDLPGEKVNKFNRDVLQSFSALFTDLKRLVDQNEIEALVWFSGKPGIFIAGADIELIQSAKNELEAFELSQTGQKVLNLWEDLPFPTVMGVHGACLGGGCELSLASRAVVMSDDASSKIGLPEVMLGIIPGMGGCVRLPRKLGLAQALDLILTGKALSGEKAYRAGLVDAVIPKENFEESTLLWVKSNLAKLKSQAPLGKKPKLGGMGGLAGQLLETTSIGRKIILKGARKSVLSKTKGHYPAPLKAIEVVENSGTGYGITKKGKERDKAMELEAKGFGAMAATEVSKNLIRLFFLTESIKKSNGVQSEQTKAASVDSAGVLGAGIMGGGIAQLFADRGILTRMKDINQKALTLGIESATKIFSKAVKRRKISQREMVQKLNLIVPTLDFEGFRGVDCVVEAVIEKMDIKKKVFQELEPFVSDRCVLASNTSSLSITEMQKALKHPERFVGMHFFNPVHKMPLIEVIRGDQTNDHAVSTIFELSKKIGKTPIVVKDAPGFLVNRLLVPYLNEAAFLLEEGGTVPEIDQALIDFGMPMGPIELIDEVGIDVGEKVLHILHDSFGPRMLPTSILKRIVESGRLGRKNGKGFYDYSPKNPNKEFNPSIYQVLGTEPRIGKLKTDEVVDRCILTMINEASRCLAEGVVHTPDDVDLGMIMGTGFPPFRGGLLRYADRLGAKEIVKRLERYAAKAPTRLAPSQELLQLAQSGQSFYRK